MSRNKFAAITSSLLARKGEAAPWPSAAPAWAPAFVAEAPPVVAPDFRFAAPERPVIAPEPRLAVQPVKAPPLPPDAVKRCTVRLTQREYERLGILAVKKNLTRQQLLQAALAETLAGMAQACAPDCGCLNRCAGS
jgi:hypothetical protein